MFTSRISCRAGPKGGPARNARRGTTATSTTTRSRSTTGAACSGINMPPGLISHAPQGVHHGMPERVRERARRRTDVDERVEWKVLAIDTRRRLTPAPVMRASALSRSPKRSRCDRRTDRRRNPGVAARLVRAHARDRRGAPLIATAPTATRESHPGFDRATWQRLAEQPGVTGLGAPEAWGGLACDTESLAGVAEEVCGVAVSGASAGVVLPAAALGDWCRRERLVADAQRGRGVLGWHRDRRCRASPGQSGVRGRRVTGRFDAVTHGGSADLLLGEVATELGPAVALVLQRRNDRVANPAQDRRSCDATDRRRGDRCPAAVLVGPLIPRASTPTVDSRRFWSPPSRSAAPRVHPPGWSPTPGVREQFGKLIGTYQAIAHRCADTAVDIAAARPRHRRSRRPRWGRWWRGPPARPTGTRRVG